MTRKKAKDQERDHLDAMIRILDLELESEPENRESPDFKLTLRTGRTVGIELVRAIDERIARGRGARRLLKKEIGAKLCSKSINARVNISISDEKAAFLATHSRALKAEVDAVFCLAQAVMSEGPRSVRFERHGWEELNVRRRRVDRVMRDLEGTGVEHLDSVSICRAVNPSVSWSGSGNGQRSNIVQDAIDGKADDLGVYRRCGADEVWLLVVGSTGSGGALFVDDVDGRTFTSPYDRTVFLERFEGRCVFLTTTLPGTLST